MTKIHKMVSPIVGLSYYLRSIMYMVVMVYKVLFHSIMAPEITET